jgi:predicted alpha/beta-hydrolase family hydrolase
MSAAVKLATRRRRIPIPGGGAVSAVVALPPGFRRAGSTPAVLIAHGAGADMRSAFVSTVHSGLAREGYVAVKFNFPYTEARRRTPDPRPVLERAYRAVLDAVARDRALRPPWIVIGGKSLGGRIASYLAAGGAPVRGLLLLGYPLHPAGKSDQLRADHLPGVPVPTLFVQGTRDQLCDLGKLRAVLAGVPRATLHSIEGGDHSFRLPRRAGRSDADVWAEIVGVTGRWLRTLDDRPSGGARRLPAG